MNTPNMNQSEEFINEIHSKRRKTCDDLCPLECDSINYELSRVKFLSTDKQLSGYLKDYNESGYVKERMIHVRIQFDELKCTRMSQSAEMTITDLVSNVGGVLGVFLEISFFSVYRIVMFVLTRISFHFAS